MWTKSNRKVSQYPAGVFGIDNLKEGNVYAYWLYRAQKVVGSLIAVNPTAHLKYALCMNTFYSPQNKTKDSNNRTTRIQSTVSSSTYKTSEMVTTSISTTRYSNSSTTVQSKSDGNTFTQTSTTPTVNTGQWNEWSICLLRRSRYNNITGERQTSYQNTSCSLISINSNEKHSVQLIIRIHNFRIIVRN